MVSELKTKTSAAISGLKIGDVLVSIDDVSVSASKMTAARANQLLRGTAGSMLGVTVSRTLGTMATTMRVRMARDVQIEEISIEQKLLKNDPLLQKNERARAVLSETASSTRRRIVEGIARPEKTGMNRSSVNVISDFPRVHLFVSDSRR